MQGYFFFWLQLDFIKVYWNNTADSAWDAQWMSFGGKYVGQVLNHEEEVWRRSAPLPLAERNVHLPLYLDSWLCSPTDTDCPGTLRKEGQLVVLQPSCASLKHSARLRVLPSSWHYCCLPALAGSPSLLVPLVTSFEEAPWSQTRCCPLLQVELWDATFLWFCLCLLSQIHTVVRQ